MNFLDTENQFSLKSFALQALVLTLLTLLLQIVLHKSLADTLWYAALCYFAWYFLARFIFLSSHLVAQKHFAQGRFAEAFAAWEQSAALFARVPWVDRHRMWVLLMVYPESLHERALAGQVACLVAQGDFWAAEAHLHRAQAQFPTSAPLRRAEFFLTEERQKAEKTENKSLEQPI